jgi:hypothetical protein
MIERSRPRLRRYFCTVRTVEEAELAAGGARVDGQQEPSGTLPGMQGMGEQYLQSRGDGLCRHVSRWSSGKICWTDAGRSIGDIGPDRREASRCGSPGNVEE